MTPLEQAIRIAIKNGWFFKYAEPNWTWELLDGDESVLLNDPDGNISSGSNSYWTTDYDTILFDHEFAKALWNTPRMWEAEFGELNFETREGLSEWQYHLTQLALSTDRLKYLADNMPKEDK